jgi:glutamyl-tRNA reductase
VLKDRRLVRESGVAKAGRSAGAGEPLDEMNSIEASPSEFLVVGLNHRTAPLEVREKLSLTKAQLPGALKVMKRYGVPGVILSTCNRSEFYAMEPAGVSNSHQHLGGGEERIKQFLADRFDISLVDIERYLYVDRGQECIHRLFRVSSSLDSMILGEEQIIGQVRAALDAASQLDTVPGPLSHLFQRALGVGRKVRRETDIGCNASSVSRACVDLARSALGDLRKLRVTVVGAGDAGKLAAFALSRSGVREITVINRTYERAEELAGQLPGRAIPFQDLAKVLRRTDIVICCTGSPGYVLEAAVVHEAMALRPERPLFLLDIAVPRDIDPAAGRIDNVHLHDVDDLETVSEANRQEKEREARRAEEVVGEEAVHFQEWWRTLAILPTMLALRGQAEKIREGELEKTLRKLDGNLSPDQLSSVEAMTHAIVNKLLHGPTVYLKGRRAPADLRVAKEIFRLADEDL